MLVGLLVSACASGPPEGAHAAGATAAPRSTVPLLATPRTVTNVVHVFRSDGQAALPIAVTVNGQCFTASIAAAGSRAYRCIAGNSLLDPCVAPPGGEPARSVVCLPDPWSPATEVRLSAALPALTPDSGVLRPWAMQLGDGARCVTVTGTVSQSHGVAMTYRCIDAGAASTPRAGLDGVSEVAHLGADGTFTPAVAVAAVWRI